MKRPKSDIREPRDEALYAEFKAVLRKNPDIAYDDAVRLALQAPQPRMWVSFYGVYRTLLRIMYGSRNAPKQVSRSHLEQEVREKYIRLSRSSFFKGASAYFLASFIISEPSRGFYVSYIYARKVIGQMRKQHQRKWRR